MTRRYTPFGQRQGQAPMVPVFAWHLPDGTETGCGTRVERDHWHPGGDDEVTLGRTICHEPTSEDDKRLKAWEARR